MTRAALYARYSSDNQREASIEDQFRLCREHAGRERWQIVGSYEDAAISGACTILRPGIQRLMRDAQHGEFNILLAEALDRISRDQADVATLFKHLKFAGVTIVTLAEGEVSELHVGLKGTMNALFLKDLAMKTHRGLRGRVEKGKAGGGLCYGYHVVKKFDGNGEPIRGDREIVPEEADIIRRIFREFASRQKPQGDRRRSEQRWRSRPSRARMGRYPSIRGHHVSCGTGIVNNELYAGVLVWNRQTSSKTRPPASACPASTRQKSGSGARFPICALSMKNRGTRFARGRRTSLSGSRRLPRVSGRPRPANSTRRSGPFPFFPAC